MYTAMFKLVKEEMCIRVIKSRVARSFVCGGGKRPGLASRLDTFQSVKYIAS